MKIGLYSKPGLDISIIQKHIEDNYKLVLLNEDKDTSCDLIVSYGGDGSVVWAGQYAIQHNCPLYSIAGGNFNFLATAHIESFEEDMKIIKEKKSSIVETLILEVVINDTQYYAINDVVMKSKESSELIHIDCFVNDQLFTGYPADGIIIATPTGSTAYNVSAGGPLLSETSQCFVVTPISSHKLSQRSVVYGDDTNIILEAKSPSQVVIDGQKKVDYQKCTITVSQKKLQRIIGTKTWEQKVQEKFHWN